MKNTIFIGLLIFGFQSCNYKNTKTEAVPTESTNPQGTSTPEETFITFKQISSDAVASCIKCHKVEKTDKPKLTLREDFIKNMNKVLEEVTGNEMPPADDGYSPLTDCQKAQLQQWYDLGSPEESNIPVSSLPACLVQ